MVSLLLNLLILRYVILCEHSFNNVKLLPQICNRHKWLNSYSFKIVSQKSTHASQRLLCSSQLWIQLHNLFNKANFDHFVKVICHRLTWNHLQGFFGQHIICLGLHRLYLWIEALFQTLSQLVPFKFQFPLFIFKHRNLGISWNWRLLCSI